MLHRNHQRAARSLCRAVSLAACLALVFVATRSAAAQQKTQESGETSVTTLTDGALTIEVKTRGTVELTDNDADVKSISEGGYFSVKEKRGAATVRQLEIVPAPGGGLRRKYSVGGQPRESDAEAGAWLGSVLPKVMRESTLGSAARVRRILGQRGVEGVLEEVASMKSDYVKRVYQQKLLELQNYDAATSARVLEHAGRSLSSEYERAELLLDVLRHDRLDDGARAAFFKTLDALGSDYEQRRVLTQVVEKHAPAQGPLNMEMVGAAFQSAMRLTSEYELAEFLIDFVKHRPLDDAVRPAFMAALDKIQSEHERARAASVLPKGERRP
jgi:hypothetical protein